MPNSHQTVPIRRNVASHKDPYSESHTRKGRVACQDCGAIYQAGRWRMPEKPETTPRHTLAPQQPTVPVACPACHRIRDDVPAGVVVLSGKFLEEHSSEILNLVANENQRSMKGNPLQRVMHIAPLEDGSVEIHTTSDKLAQRIGKALHSAYSGEVRYLFCSDTKLTRVMWQRSA